MLNFLDIWVHVVFGSIANDVTSLDFEVSIQCYVKRLKMIFNSMLHSTILILATTMNCVFFLTKISIKMNIERICTQ
jgi:hypothetical protein